MHAVIMAESAHALRYCQQHPRFVLFCLLLAPSFALLQTNTLNLVDFGAAKRFPAHVSCTLLPPLAFLCLLQTNTLNLIDFGAAKHFPEEFVHHYMEMVAACADRDKDKVIKQSMIMGFLTGDEAQVTKNTWEGGQERHRDGGGVASAERDKDKGIKQSMMMGFLTGDESQVNEQGQSEAKRGGLQALRGIRTRSSSGA